jgi:hypothetical protein
MVADLMGRLGHATPAMAMIYQHTAAHRDRLIADRLSQIALGTQPSSSARVSKPRATSRPKAHRPEQPSLLEA